jgi:hypothetical protein
MPPTAVITARSLWVHWIIFEPGRTALKPTDAPHVCPAIGKMVPHPIQKGAVCPNVEAGTPSVEGFGYHITPAAALQIPMIRKSYAQRSGSVTAGYEVRVDGGPLQVV